MSDVSDKMIEELETADNKSIMIVREKLHHYRWLSSKLLPNLYGDKQEVIQDTKVTIEWKKPDMIDVSSVDSSQKNGLAHVMELDKKIEGRSAPYMHQGSVLLLLLLAGASA